MSNRKKKRPSSTCNGCKLLHEEICVLFEASRNISNALAAVALCDAIMHISTVALVDEEKHKKLKQKSSNENYKFNFQHQRDIFHEYESMCYHNDDDVIELKEERRPIQSDTDDIPFALLALARERELQATNDTES